MLHDRHVADLTSFVDKLRKRGNGQVPYFDPLDGGVEARVLFLLQKPRPMAVSSGFISRNNADETAKAVFKIMGDVRIPRKRTVLWNIIPWWDGTSEFSPQYILSGIECLKDLMPILRNLRAGIMVGLETQKARPVLEETTELTLFASYLPVPRVRSDQAKWGTIPIEWAKVLPFVGDP